jgi:hypothetical protein
MGYEVEVQDLRDSADAANDAARQVRTADPAGALSGAETAVPGADAENAIQSVSFWWDLRFSAWAGRAEGYATRLQDNAQRYESAEATAAAAFGGPR